MLGAFFSYSITHGNLPNIPGNLPPGINLGGEVVPTISMQATMGHHKTEISPGEQLEQKVFFFTMPRLLGTSNEP